MALSSGVPCLPLDGGGIEVGVKGNTMRTFFILSFVANLVLTLISLDILPYCVAVHFGPGGVPNG